MKLFIPQYLPLLAIFLAFSPTYADSPHPGLALLDQPSRSNAQDESIFFFSDEQIRQLKEADEAFAKGEIQVEKTWLISHLSHSPDALKALKRMITSLISPGELIFELGYRNFAETFPDQTKDALNLSFANHFRKFGESDVQRSLKLQRITNEIIILYPDLRLEFVSDILPRCLSQLHSDHAKFMLISYYLVNFAQETERFESDRVLRPNESKRLEVLFFRGLDQASVHSNWISKLKAALGYESKKAQVVSYVPERAKMQNKTMDAPFYLGETTGPSDRSRYLNVLANELIDIGGSLRERPKNFMRSIESLVERCKTALSGDRIE